MSGSATNVPFKAPQLCHLRRNRRRIAAGKVRLRGWSGSAFVFWCVGELEGPHARLSQGPAGRECRAPNIRHFHNHDRQQHFSVIIIVTIIILREGTFIHRHTYIHIYTFIPTIYTDIYKYIQYLQYIQIYTNIYNTYNIYRYIQIYTYLYTNIYKYIQIYTNLFCLFVFWLVWQGKHFPFCERIQFMWKTLKDLHPRVLMTVGGEKIWWST